MVQWFLKHSLTFWLFKDEYCRYLDNIRKHMRCPTDHLIWQLFVLQANSRWVTWCIIMQLCHDYSRLWKGLPSPGDCRAAILYSVQRQGKAGGAYDEQCHEALKMLFLWSKTSGHRAETGWLKKNPKYISLKYFMKAKWTLMISLTRNSTCKRGLGTIAMDRGVVCKGVAGPWDLPLLLIARAVSLCAGALPIPQLKY